MNVAWELFSEDCVALVEQGRDGEHLLSLRSDEFGRNLIHFNVEPDSVFAGHAAPLKDRSFELVVGSWSCGTLFADFSAGSDDENEKFLVSLQPWDPGLGDGKKMCTVLITRTIVSDVVSFVIMWEDLLVRKEMN